VDALFRVQSPTGSLFLDVQGGTHNVNQHMKIEVPGRLRSESCAVVSVAWAGCSACVLVLPAVHCCLVW
jgi:hypothetical protein